jgi:hypothetical protein
MYPAIGPPYGSSVCFPGVRTLAPEIGLHDAPVNL